MNPFTHITRWLKSLNQRRHSLINQGIIERHEEHLQKRERRA